MKPINTAHIPASLYIGILSRIHLLLTLSREYPSHQLRSGTNSQELLSDRPPNTKDVGLRIRYFPAKVVVKIGADAAK